MGGGYLLAVDLVDGLAAGGAGARRGVGLVDAPRGEGERACGGFASVAAGGGAGQRRGARLGLAGAVEGELGEELGGVPGERLAAGGRAGE
jgi:hypothetical protein